MIKEIRQISKKLFMTAIICVSFFSFSSFADIISDTPFENENVIVISSEPGSESSTPSSIEPEIKHSDSSFPGLTFLNETSKSEKPFPGTFNLGFELISPAFSYGDYLVAEGSVQLSDGSWAEISHKQVIKNPYYRLLREATDYSGEDWYIVAVCGNRFGNFYTPDNSTVKELWLKKSDCTKTSALSIETNNEKRLEIVKTALSLLGKQYASCGDGPDAFDCSGFVHYVMQQAGINVPRNSSAICAMDGQIGISQLKPGDIVGRAGHVGIYIGNDIFIHAAESSTGVVTDTLTNYNSKNHFNHYINILGD